MTRQDKIAFAIAATLQKKMKTVVAVCRSGGAVEWRIPEGGFAVANIDNVSPRHALDCALHELNLLRMKKGK